MITHYLETNSTDPYFNLAFEEYVLLHRTKGNYLLLWQNDNTVVIGQNQNTIEEIDYDYVRKHNIAVVRRSTGGGAVYHDLGNLNYSFITDAGNAEELTISKFTTPVVMALQQLGLDATASGRNDILVNGYKVSGTAQRLAGKRILHHGTLLFDTNPLVMENALRVRPEKFRSKSVKSVRSRVGNIKQFLPKDLTISEFWQFLKTALAENGLLQEELSAQEIAEINKLRDEKYATWDWNFGHSPAYNMRNSRCFSSGILEVRVNVVNGAITQISFWGDFLSRRDLTPICNALIGCDMREDAIMAALAPFRNIDDFFGGISLNDVCATICNQG